MSLTRVELEAVAEELAALGVPSGVQKVYERDERAVVLQLRGGGATRYLLVDTTPELARAHFVSSKPTQPQHPSAFTMLLRKHLAGSGFTGLRLVPGDRIARFEFTRRSDDEVTNYELVAELTGRHGNLFLLRGDRILGQQHGSSGKRELRPGDAWEPPPPPPQGLESEDRVPIAELPVGERSEALDAFYVEFVEETELAELRTRLSSGLKREAKRLRRLRKNVETDLEKAEEAQHYKRFGELLRSAYGREIERGAEGVTVPDYYADGAPDVEIPLDPAKSLQENIDRYFHEYRRLTGAIDQIEERLLETMERLDEVEAARAEFRETSDGELREFARSVESKGLLRERKQQRRGRGSNEPLPPYRTFRSRSGARILVGRGSKHNDALTTRIARGRDVWLHARDWAGAHVVLRMSKGAEPDGEDLLDAAMLAAHFSRGRGDSLVDVTHTRAKHVRKPKGAAPGLVTVAGGSTMGIAPDPQRLERLLATEERN